ncbi:MAG: zinc ribbon domain-containing protein [Promethearchaeota archaeon]
MVNRNFHHRILNRITFYGVISILLIFSTIPVKIHVPDGKYTFSGSNFSSSSYAINENITIEGLTAPNFTWLDDINVSITFNYSAPNGSAPVYVHMIMYGQNAFENTNYTFNLSPGISSYNLTLKLLLTTTPGEKNLTFYFTRAINESIYIYHVVWVGTGWIFLGSFVFATMIIIIAISLKYKTPSADIEAAVTGPVSSYAITPEDEDTTVSFVDQSRAPPGRIFCPECKKVIEEGSIFCPECGTRIPRYLRFHPE